MNPQAWKALDSTRYAELRERADPYLWLADALGYPDQAPQLAAKTAAGAGTAFAVSIEWRGDSSASATRSRLRVPGLHLHAAHRGSLYSTGTATPAACRALLESDDVLRVVFAEPLRTQRPPLPWQGSLVVQRPAAARVRNHKRSRVLLGVIDSGCPFAHHALRGPAGGTRVRALWDQGSNAHWAGAGRAPSGFGYGRSLDGADLEALMKLSSHDAEVYRLCGYGPAMTQASHGAHSLGLLAAVPPAPGARADEASASDIAFVQLPHELLSCVSVAALENRALDGCRYILQQFRKGSYERAVISFGYESWLGPHDGSSWFERALDALIAETLQSDGEPALKVFLIAGNSKARRAHAAAAPGETALDLQLAVPPDLEVATWIEFWLPQSLQDADLLITPPGLADALPPIASRAGTAWTSDPPGAISVVTHQDAGSHARGRLVLLRIAPTHVLDGRQAAAPHGLWRLRLDAGSKALGDVNVYVGRSEASLSASGAGQPAFVGRGPLVPRLALNCTWNGCGPQTPLRDTDGTLNGHAGGARVVVSGAYFGASFQGPVELRSTSTPYSGSGPMRNKSRAGPSDALAVEEGVYQAGLPGIGNACGQRFRLSGTSTAAPLRARVEANRTEAGPAPKGRDKELGSQLIDPGRP